LVIGKEASSLGRASQRAAYTTIVFLTLCFLFDQSVRSSALQESEMGRNALLVLILGHPAQNSISGNEE
jgi:hypothetical protein